MKNYLLLFLLFGFGMSMGVYGQEETKKLPPKIGRAYQEKYMRPEYDTVIMQGSEVKVGVYLRKPFWRGVEIVDSGKSIGKSDESDFKKGYYFTRHKPQQTTTYKFVLQDSESKDRFAYFRTVYVAKTEAGKKQFEKQLKEQKEAVKRKQEEASRTGRIDFSVLKQLEPKKK